DGERIPAPRVSRAASWPRRRSGDDHLACVGRQPRSVHERPRGARPAAPSQDRRRVRGKADPHAARRRISPRRMTPTGKVRGSAAPASLAQLRRRLTAWYALTFLAVLALLGVAVFAAITRQFDRELDASLGVASNELVRVST